MKYQEQHPAEYAESEISKLGQGADYLPEGRELRLFATHYFDLRQMSKDGVDLENMLVNPNPAYLIHVLPLLKMGTLRIGARDELSLGGEVYTIPDMTLGVTDPLHALTKPNSPHGVAIGMAQGASGDTDPNAWPYLRSKADIAARKAAGELPAEYDPPYGVKAQLMVHRFGSRKKIKNFLEELNAEEMADKGLYKLQLLAYEHADGRRNLAYAYVPDVVSDGVDQIMGYTSWIDYVKDYPEALPRAARSKARAMPYETDFHKDPSVPQLDKPALYAALSRTLSAALRDKAAEDPANWQKQK